MIREDELGPPPPHPCSKRHETKSTAGLTAKNVNCVSREGKKVSRMVNVTSFCCSQIRAFPLASDTSQRQRNDAVWQVIVNAVAI